MAARKQIKNYVRFDKITPEDSKLKFTLTLEGEWDFNKNFSGSLDHYHLLSIYMHKPNFIAALQEFMASQIFDRLFTVETVKLSAIISPAMNAAYDKAHKEIADEEFKSKQEEINRLEKELKDKRDRLGVDQAPIKVNMSVRQVKELP